MSTPTSRRAFLGHLAALAAAPLVAHAAAKQTQPKEPAYQLVMDPAGPGSDATDHHAVWVQGLAIKVPSNRVRCWSMHLNGEPRRGIPDYYDYHGDWDGTFQLERGCTNPAYVLADLYHRTGAEPDWVVKRHWAPGLYKPDARRLLKPVLNWQMLYNWGRHCDEVVTASHDLPTSEWPHHWVLFGRGARGEIRSDRTGPRFTVKLEPGADLGSARRVLRMYCLKWQSTDPRYRTSWPGVPYPEVHA